jgi:hypothetical protein
MYTYFLLTDTGLDFLVDAVSVPDAIEFVEKMLHADPVKSQVVCVLPANEVTSYFEAVQ